MSRIQYFVVGAIALAACSGTDATPRKAATSQTTSVAASAGGNVAVAAMPNDTISTRADHGRILGDTNAKVWLIMASDFQCPYCKQWHDSSFPKIVKAYVATGQVRLAYLNYPLNQHPNAMPAAEAAMCTSAQNKFWPMHDKLFALQAKWESLQDPTPVFDSLAASVGVDMESYRTCVGQHLTRPLIEADHDRGSRAGVGSTPTFFVDALALPGADADVAGAIDAELAKAAAATKKN